MCEAAALRIHIILTQDLVLELILVWFLVFGFGIQHCSPVVDTLLPAKTWARATALSAFIGTVRFRSIRTIEIAIMN